MRSKKPHGLIREGAVRKRVKKIIWYVKTFHTTEAIVHPSNSALHISLIEACKTYSQVVLKS